ncbi:glycosyltransferase [Kocuria sp. CPCC 205258]|jgi:glycosyltransferase involved in cell wall biosynthesis|uniref:glycosyltransferase family 2 protein n=1 Tax=Kocuria sp. CPCC 205258 TaxID=3073552 RepID=UPI0034D4CA08
MTTDTSTRTDPDVHDQQILPSVSVVIATAGRPAMLRDAVRGVIAQDYAGPVELIVVYDNIDIDPLDDLDVPETLPLRTLANTRTRGLAGGRNTGILAAEGDLIAFCDDDDVWSPEKLRLQTDLWRKHPEAVAIAGGIRIVSDARTVERVPPAVADFDDFLVSRITEIHPSALVCRRADLLGPVGLVDEVLPASYGEDYDLLLRAARLGPVRSVPETVLTVHWDRPSFFADEWNNIAEGLTYILRKYPEFEATARGTARITGQVAFAHAAEGQRHEAARWARATLRRDPRQLRAWGALAVATGGVSPDRLLQAVHNTGRGL